MRTTDRIGFKLIIKEPDTAERTIVVCPRYDGLKMKWNPESGKVYHTLDFDGNLEFCGVDFVTLLNCPLRTVFELVVFLKGRGEVGRSEFRKTDCEWNLNDGWCKVDISTYDKYSKINDHKDDEFNLVKILDEKKSLSYYVNALLQIYIKGTDHISNWTYQKDARISNLECTAESSNVKLVKEQYFSHINQYDQFFTFLPNVIGVVNMAGRRCGIMDGESVQWTLDGGGHEGSLNYYLFIMVFPEINGNNEAILQVRLYYDGNTYDHATARWQLREFGTYPYTSEWEDFDTMSPIVNRNLLYHGTESQIKILGRIYFVYSRIITLKTIPSIDYVSGELGKDDICRCERMYGKGTIQRKSLRMTANTSNEDLGYGRVADSNLYFAPPDSTGRWEPIEMGNWFENYSLWTPYQDNQNTKALLMDYTGETRCNDFYLFTDAVRAVIKKIDPSIEFEANDSHFLFDNPNPLQSSAKPQGPLYISQKSNVLNLGYDYPAWQAPIKWSQIETFLKNVLGCYYDLYEDSNGVTHLRIEHQFFYDNGGTYNQQGNPSTRIDLLNERFDVATRQPQAFHTNRWKWDVDGNGLYSSACRYEYGWMDTQSAIFDGETIEVPEEYRLFTDDKTEERKVDWFSSDIDFLTAVQAECSSDGFVVVMESYTNPGWIVSGHENYSGQNYQMSFEYLQPLYLVYGIYAEKVKIGDNGTAYDTGSHARMRTSEVSFNLIEGEWVEPSDVLTTEVGNGVIDTLTYDMSSDKWTATVRYNNE